jgi:polysaccharide export outer membrane protein
MYRWRRQSACRLAVLTVGVLCGGFALPACAQGFGDGSMPTSAIAPEAQSQPPQSEDGLGFLFDEERRAPAAAAAPTVPGDSDDYPIQSGDRLRVRVFDRPDLTAEYRVNDKGKIRIPTLGAFAAAHAPAPRLEAAIADSLERLLQRPGIVTVEIVERRPIFVTGLVVKQGAYRFSPGIAVLHAVALAGGTSPSALAPWLPGEALREGARALTSKSELKHLLALEASLQAEWTGSAGLAMPPELLQLAGEEEATRLLQKEEENMVRRREVLGRRSVLLKRTIEETKSEIQAFRNELAKIREQRQIRKTALDTLEALSKKGLTTEQRLTDSRFLVVSADRDIQTAIANISRSQQNLAKAEHDLAVLALDRKTAIAKELQDTIDRITAAKATLDSARKIVAHITGLPSTRMLQDRNPQFRYEIVRKGSDGELHAIAATELTKLQPGDVVRVGTPHPGSSPLSISTN